MLSDYEDKCNTSTYSTVTTLGQGAAGVSLPVFYNPLFLQSEETWFSNGCERFGKP